MCNKYLHMCEPDACLYDNCLCLCNEYLLRCTHDMCICESMCVRVIYMHVLCVMFTSLRDGYVSAYQMAVCIV